MRSVAVCDDNAVDREYIVKLVSKWSGLTGNEVAISLFKSAEDFMFQRESGQDIDILILDIEMGNMDGVSLAKRLRLTNPITQIIFATGYPDYISEGYEVSALHYLMKPVSEAKLFSTLDRAVKLLSKRERFVMFSVNGELIHVPINDIIFAEAFAHSCVINLVNSVFEVKSSITDVEKSLGEGFIKCHRSYIVAIKYIKSISRTDITLDSGKTVPISRSNYDLVNQAFIKYFRGDIS